MEILIFLWHALLLVGCITLCRADVTIAPFANFTVDIANSGGLGATSVSTTVDNEIDDIVFEWNDPTRTPAFQDFYSTEFVSVNPQLFIVTLRWNTDKTPQERKQAGGVVLCKAVSGGNVLKSITFAISVSWKPEPSSLTLEYTGDDIILGGSLSLRCSSSDKGNPTAQVKWTVDGDLKSGGRYNNDNLVINPIEKTDAGEWKCYYGNDKGMGTESATKTVDVKWKPEPSSLTLEYTGDDIILGSSLTLRCSSPDKGNPPGLVKWIVDGYPKSGGRYNDENITINPVEKTDAGEWKCYYGNEIGKGTESETKTVDVKWRPEPSSLTLEYTGDHIILGSSITLRCSSPDKGNPPGLVKWTVDGNFKSGGRYNNEHITINPIEKTDVGEWKCYYGNKIGKGTESETKTVDVKWPPGAATLVIDGMDDNSVKQGQQITLRCAGDTGNPLEQVLWIFDKSINKITSTTYHIFDSEPRHNGTWSCMFMNRFGNGTVSQGVALTVLLTPLPPIMKLVTSTTISLTISIGLMSDTNTAMESYHMNMNITLVGNNTSISVIQPAAIEEYTFYNLEPWTTYNISVFYNNDVGAGEAVLQTFTTKKLPVLKTPIVTRSLLDAGVKMTIKNPNSTNRITILVCQIGETDSNKCNVETIEEIAEGDTNKRIYASFSNRIVNVSMYDNGVQVYAYGDEIGPAVVVIVLIVLTGVVLFVVIIVISIVVIKERSKDDSTLKENNVQYENVAQDTRLNGITNAALNPEYEDVSPIGTTNGCNSDNTTYMGLDQTDVQRTRDRPTELTVYQSLN